MFDILINLKKWYSLIFSIFCFAFSLFCAGTSIFLEKVWKILKKNFERKNWEMDYTTPQLFYFILFFRSYLIRYDRRKTRKNKVKKILFIIFFSSLLSKYFFVFELPQSLHSSVISPFSFSFYTVYLPSFFSLQVLFSFFLHKFSFPNFSTSFSII